MVFIWNMYWNSHCSCDKKIKIKRLKSVQILASARNNTSVFTDELLRLQRLISEVSSSTGMKMWIV